jgi:hypothetical protein
MPVRFSLFPCGMLRGIKVGSAAKRGAGRKRNWPIQPSRAAGSRLREFMQAL